MAYFMFRLVAISVLLFTLGGCSTRQPINAWQDRLTDYTMKEGGGDLNILRESAELRSSDSLRPAQIRFDHDTAHGVLVGQHAEADNPAFFFLVGVIDRPSGGRATKIQDVRLMSCKVRDGRYQWSASDPNPEALNKYVTARHEDAASFPATDDDFQFEVRDGHAQASDARSGAVWRIPLN
jgi:hypothetical protein